MFERLCLTALTYLVLAGPAAEVRAAGSPAALVPPRVVVDLDVGEERQIDLTDGGKAVVKLLAIDEKRDPIRNAVREARAHVEINGQRAWLTSANYRLPQTVGGVQVDCPATQAINKDANRDAWALDKAARLRLWPAQSPWINEGTFTYPVRQRWFASSSQMANEPVFVDHAERLAAQKIYYHWGLDFGGSEGQDEVVSAIDGLVVSVGTERLAGHEGTPVAPRYDVVYLLDQRGWYYRYSHLHTIDPAITPGATVRQGQRIGLLGKEGGSGGWSHLHFDIYAKQPSGRWGCEEAYAYAWEAYQREFSPKIIAVARPHQFVLSGDEVELCGSRSWAAEPIASYQWQFSDGSTAQGAKVRRTYQRAGYYSELLRIADRQGNTSLDVVVIIVIDREHRDRLPPSVHVVYHPSLENYVGREISFKARTFGTQAGEERWDFGDGSPVRTTKSDGNQKPLAPDGYVEWKHTYEKPGVYVVSVERTNEHGVRSVGRVWLDVKPAPESSHASAASAAPTPPPAAVCATIPAATTAMAASAESPAAALPADAAEVSVADQPEGPPVVRLWPGKAPGEKGDIGPEKIEPPKDEPKPITRITNVTEPTITVFKPPAEKDTGAAVLICPGGGYSILAFNHEGEDVARWLNAHGATGVLLKYRVPRRAGLPKHLAPLQDAQRAMSLVRANAEQWKIDPKRVGILGFSAGGHLAAAASCNFDQRQYEPIDEIDRLSCRPDFAVLVYPAYLAEKDELAPEIRVTKETPPTLFIHAADDRISPENSIAMFRALRRQGVAAELHIYGSGGHGFGMHDNGQPVNRWPDRAADWMKQQGWLKKAE